MPEPPCDHCGAPSVGVVWIQTALGLTTRRACGTECGYELARTHPEQPAKRVKAPDTRSKLERMKAAAAERAVPRGQARP